MHVAAHVMTALIIERFASVTHAQKKPDKED